MEPGAHLLDARLQLLALEERHEHGLVDFVALGGEKLADYFVKDLILRVKDTYICISKGLIRMFRMKICDILEKWIKDDNKYTYL